MSTAQDVIGTLNGLSGGNFGETDRVKVERALLGALRRIQKPFDTALNHCWTEPAVTAYVRTLIDAGFWSKWVEAGGKPSSLSELASLGDIDVVLLKRILRLLAAQGLIGDDNGDGLLYELTDYSRALAQPQFAALYDLFHHFNGPSFSNFPRFAAKTGYRNPTDPTSTNFMDWSGGIDTFTYLSSNPLVAAGFNQAMAVNAAAKISWVDQYPTERIIADAKPGHALVVDVAGGLGHDLESFVAKHPEAHGLVLQDLPHVIEASPVKAPIQKQAVDIFEDQPVKGARVYFLKIVLHDWPDTKAVEILKIIGGAMERGYSRVLLSEAVIARCRPHPRSLASDAAMMMCFSATERDEEEWSRLVRDAGFKIVTIHAREAPEPVIELDLI